MAFLQAALLTFASSHSASDKTPSNATAPFAVDPSGNVLVLIVTSVICVPS